MKSQVLFVVTLVAATAGPAYAEDDVRGDARPALVVLVDARPGQAPDTSGPKREIESLLTARGFTVAPAPDTGTRGFPSDSAAAEVARRARAGAAVIVDMETQGDGFIRGTDLVGARGQARVRVIEVSDTETLAIAEARVTGAGFASEPDGALTAAAAELASRLVTAVAPAMIERWPARPSGDNLVLIQVRGFSGWTGVAALMTHLAASSGVVRVWPRQLGSRGVVLAVATDLGRRRVAALLRRASVPDSRVEVASWGEDGLVATLHTGGQP